LLPVIAERTIMADHLRKFLVVSTYAPPAISGTPLMIYNLLSRFPRDSFAVLTSHAGMDDRVINGGKKLDAKYFFFDTPKLAVSAETENSLFQRTKKFIKGSRILAPFFRFLSLFYLPVNIVGRGKKIIRDEKIELLLCYSDHGPALFSTYLLHHFTKKPFFVHFYDLYYKNRFPWFYRVLAYFVEPKLFRDAEEIFVMDESLGDYYKKKYGRNVTIIHNSIPIDKSKVPQPPVRHEEPYKIAYTGTIAWPQVGAIKNLVRAVGTMSGPRVELYLYTPHNKEYLAQLGIFPDEKVIFASGLPREMPAIQRSVDILFVGLSFNTKYPLLINTSSPGKTYEYLVSGTPLLIHAPRESYIVHYAKEHKFACVVDEDSVERLEEGIAKLISDRGFMEEVTANAWKTALANHDADKTSRELQEFFLKK
jgi:glycosyltransferase involved in cell wall biosynthesis